MQLLVFVVATVMVIAGAIGVIVLNQAVHAALGLVLTLFGVAVHFVAMEAHFLAVVQVIVYAGAIVVLIMFVIMLLGVGRAEDLRVEPLPIQRPLAAVLGVAIVALLVAAIFAARDSGPLQTGVGLDVEVRESANPDVADDVTPDANIKQLGRNLFGDQVFAFELTGVLLVVAVAGTVVMTRRGESAPGRTGEFVHGVPRSRRRHCVPRPRRVLPAQRLDAPSLALGRAHRREAAFVLALTAPVPTETWYLVLGAVLFGIGAVGVLVRRNPLVLLMCIELMLNAVTLSFVALSRSVGTIDGQTAVFFILVVAAAEAVVGLGIIVAILRRRPGATADDLTELRG